MLPVVLLDEADVFLEERSLSDLQRNALVSGEFSEFVLFSLSHFKIGGFDK